MFVFFQVKGSVLSYLAALGLSSTLWSLAADRVATGIARLNAPLVNRKKRVEQISGGLIALMIDFVMPKLPRNTKQLDQVSLKDLRTIVLLLIQYHLLARISDARRLRACDLKIVSLEGKEAIEVRFNKCKNDQVGLGSLGYIARDIGKYCPVGIIKVYYARCCYFFFDERTEDINYLFPRLRMAKSTRIQIPDGRWAVSQGTLVTNIKHLAKAVGCTHKVSGKSAKIGGTSAAFSSGLSDNDIRDKGRWRSLESAQHYRRATDAHKLHLASAYTLSSQTSDHTRDLGQQPRARAFDPFVHFSYVDDGTELMDSDIQWDQRLYASI